MTRKTTIALLCLLACVLVLMAFVPHHHADGDATKPCAACISMQNAAASMPADAPPVAVPQNPQARVIQTAALPVTVEYHAPLIPRAPPA